MATPQKPLSPPPNIEPIGGAIVPNAWSSWFTQLWSFAKTTNGGSAYLFMQADTPVINNDTSVLWVANAVGTIDGKSYGIGDLIYTARLGSVQKSKILAVWATM